MKNLNLIIDIGNTRIKVALFHHSELVRCVGMDSLDEKSLGEWLSEDEVGRAILSTTRDLKEGEEETVRRFSKEVLLFTPQTKVPIQNAYQTPQTLGRDRLAAAVGAVEMFPQKDVLIVDFGTALTIDYVSKEGVFCGGSISPGMKLRFKALNDYTARLPLCEASEQEMLVGTSTRQAIEMGVMNSISFEIEGYIERMRKKNKDLCVIFTGGDAKVFVKRIKNTIFAKCNPIFVGLNRILEYNVREENLD